nr:hypothetical protein [Xenorhabdus budapestensis]
MLFQELDLGIQFGLFVRLALTQVFGILGLAGTEHSQRFVPGAFKMRHGRLLAAVYPDIAL